MRTDLALALALTFAAACTTTASPAPVQPVPENKCAHVADHLLSLLTASAKEAPGEELDRVRNVFHSRCRDDGWSAQAQQCFLALTAKFPLLLALCGALPAAGCGVRRLVGSSRHACARDGAAP
jgi:hypothetical protein